MEFWVKLIQVEKEQTVEAVASLKGNCTHVDKFLWLFEGEEWALEEDGVKFKVLSEGAVGSLGGLSKNELIDLCKDTFWLEDKMLWEK